MFIKKKKVAAAFVFSKWKTIADEETDSAGINADNKTAVKKGII